MLQPNRKPHAVHGQAILEFLIIGVVAVLGLLAARGPISQALQGLFGDAGQTEQEATMALAGLQLEGMPGIGEREQEEPEVAEDEEEEGGQIVVASGGPAAAPRPSPPIDSGGLGGSGGGRGGGGGGGGGSGGIGGGGSGGATTAPPVIPPGSVFGGGGAVPTGLVYIPRGTDIWTDWPLVNEINIDEEIGAGVLRTVFSLVAASRAHGITDDITARGIPIGFIDQGTFDRVCTKEAVACFVPLSSAAPPAAPDPPPVIVFNPTYLSEPLATLAAVLVHEGTHLQEYLDGRLLDSSRGTVDNEFDAFWNSAAFWEGIRFTQAPFTTPLERDLEGIYQTARQGEAELRDLIAARYCDGAADC